MKIRRNNLTLIELLVVMGLAILLMTIAIPSFMKMIKGNAVDQATAQLKLGLERARAEAISSRRYVALILPNGEDSSHSIWKHPEEKQALLGGYRSAYVKKNLETGEWNFCEWVPNEKWQKANSNAHICFLTNQKAKADAIGDEFSDSPLKIKDPLLSISNGTFFKLSSYDVSCAVIFSPYGSLKGESDLYFTIIESKIDGEQLNILSKSNFLSLKISRLNGLVEYY